MVFSITTLLQKKFKIKIQLILTQIMLKLKLHAERNLFQLTNMVK